MNIEDQPNYYLSNISGANQSMTGLVSHLINVRDGDYVPDHLKEVMGDLEVTLKSQMQWINRMERSLYGKW